MKRIISSSLAFLIVCLLFISCQKSSVEPAKKTTIFSSAENRTAIAKAFKNYFEQNNTAARLSAGAEHLVPFFSAEGQGVANFNPVAGTLTFGSFFAELGAGDFFRRNPDGTYSVHVNSNSAIADYFVLDLNTFSTLEYLYGSPAHLTADYTGEVVEIFPGFYIIDTENSGRAVSVHGNGNVSANGEAPWRRLSIKAVTTPGGQRQVELNLR
jgi:hypothetical protein